MASALAGRTIWKLFGGLGSLALISAACIQLAAPHWRGVSIPVPGGETDTSSAQPVEELLISPTASVPSNRINLAGRQTAEVVRGPIAERLSVSGRVGGSEEVPLAFPVVGRVEALAVRVGDVVDEGQVLLQVELRDGVKALNAARVRLETSSARLERAETQAQARQREAQRRLETERATRQQGFREAEAALRRAATDLERVRAGPSRAERLERDAAVVAARAGVERAEAEFTRMTAGPSEAEVRAAEQQLSLARLTLQRAEAEQARVMRGPDPVQVRAAQRDVATAQTALDRAQADLERLTRGPDPVVVAAAEREVQRADLALRTAQASKVDKDSRAAREAAIANAQLGLQDARDRLGRARQGPAPWETDVARRNVQVAQADLKAAQERLAEVLKGPDRLVIDAANLEVERARTQLEEAEARLSTPRPGAAEEQAAAMSAITSARAALAVATARLAELNSRPTRAELIDAEERAASAQAALERLRAQPEPLENQEPDPDAAELVVLRKAVEQDRAEVESLEQELASNRLLAPFAGGVAAIHVRAGEPLEPGRPVVALARPGDPIVRVELAESDVARLAPGQTAVVQLAIGDGMSVSGSVLAVVGRAETSPALQVAVPWMGAPPALGAPAQVVVTLQQRENALLAPLRAIRSAGTRRYVEYLEDGNRRTADVEVGIVAGNDAEIVRGLTEGQLLLIGP